MRGCPLLGAHMGLSHLPNNFFEWGRSREILMSKVTNDTAALVAKSLEEEQKAEKVSIVEQSALDQVMESPLIPGIVKPPTDLSPSDLMRLMAKMAALEPDGSEGAPDLPPEAMLELSADIYDVVRKLAAVSRDEFDAAFALNATGALEFVMLYAGAAGELFSSGN